jgi:hypothetical protein
MSRFTLEPGNWYAMEVISPEFRSDIRHCSPIAVHSLSPAGGGKRCFDLEFYHAAYPAGVRDKTYTLQTIKRAEYFLLASVVGTERLALFMELTDEWLEKNGAPSLDLSRRIGSEPYRVPSGFGLKEIFGVTERAAFGDLRWKAELMREYSLPEIGYPVPYAAIKAAVSGQLDIGFEELLYWLQVYTAILQVRWRDYGLSMLRLAELTTIEPPVDVIALEGKTFWLELGCVDRLNNDIVTIQRDDELLGAFEARNDGTLRFEAYHSLDARAIGFVTGLALKPNADGSIPMQRSNWESALAGSAGMGQVYAAQRGDCYLSRWEFGLGISADGTRVAGWHEQRAKRPQKPRFVATQIEIFTSFQQLLGE